MMAMVVARNTNPLTAHIRKEGISNNERLVAFASKQSHYSITRAAQMIGIGMDGVVQVTHVCVCECTCVSVQ
jgi:glutamate/tyrosine decarboxylase-like PLP-dependent enzyme